MGDPYLRDLLGHQRSWRQRRRRRWVSALALMVLVVGVGYTWRSYQEALPREVVTQVAVANASQRVIASVVAARKPIKIVQARPAGEEPTTRPGDAQARWEQGQYATLHGKIERDESVFAALQKRGIPTRSIQAAIAATRKEYNFRRSRPGHTWSAEVSEQGDVLKFRYQSSPEDIWETVRTEQGDHVCEKVKVALESRQEVIGGIITGSLWHSMESVGASGAIVQQFMDVFAHTIDFSTETHHGDTFALIYEKIYLDGRFLRDGRILAAAYNTTEQAHRAFYHELSDGESGYYDAQGQSVQRQFLKSPLASVRVSSHFGRRFHPVLRRWKLHAGVDYAAPTGTPVMAVADGVVSFAGVKGANGKLVSIKHKQGYSTHYAHLSRIASGIKRGVQVDKKTIVGLVGSTGRSTGPHLHFGMSRYGYFINPLEEASALALMRGEPLTGDARERFVRDVVKPMSRRLAGAHPGGLLDPAPREEDALVRLPERERR